MYSFFTAYQHLAHYLIQGTIFRLQELFGDYKDLLIQVVQHKP